MKFYLADGAYWQTVTSPVDLAAAIKIGPWVFTKDGDHYRALSAPTDEDRAAAWSGPVSYHGEDPTPPNV